LPATPAGLCGFPGKFCFLPTVLVGIYTHAHLCNAIQGKRQAPFFTKNCNNMPTCASAVLPAVNFNFCDPDVRFGQIERVYVTRAGTGDVFTDWEDASEWATRIDNDAVIPGSGAAPIRELTGIGGLAEATVTETDISGGRKTSSVPQQVINFNIDELSLENITAARTYQQSPAATHKIWFKSGGLMYGGGDGIDVSLVSNLVIPEGKTEVSKINYKFKWEGYIPSAIVSPI
jgi:hypothetical protein